MHRASVLFVFALVAPASAREPVPLTLRELLGEIAPDRKAVERALDGLGRDPAAGGFLHPDQRKHLLDALARGKDALPERFPVVTLVELTQIAQKAGKLGRAKETRPPERATPAAREALGIPTGKPPREQLAPLANLGRGVTRGYEADPARQKTLADSERLADVLNRLSLNGLEGVGNYAVVIDRKEVGDPARLIQALAKGGHRVIVRDARYCANFGNLLYKGRDVTTPLWIDTQLPLSGGKGTLQVPASHSQHELVVEGPVVRAEVAFYFGVDGVARFRPIPMKSQGWVGGQVVHVYRGEKAYEAIRLAGAVRRVYFDRRRRFPELPFNGYYALGVCNDSTALIELALNKKTTLFPLVRDLAFFRGDGEIDVLARKLPIDDGKSRPQRERILGSLPVKDLADLAFPSLRRDLEAFTGGK